MSLTQQLALSIGTCVIVLLASCSKQQDTTTSAPTPTPLLIVVPATLPPRPAVILGEPPRMPATAEPVKTP
jgi:hypothetical protein